MNKANMQFYFKCLRRIFNLVQVNRIDRDPNKAVLKISKKYQVKTDVINSDCVVSYLINNYYQTKLTIKMGNSESSMKCLQKQQYSDTKNFTKIRSYNDQCGQFILEKQTQQQFLIVNVRLSSDIPNRSQFEQYLKARKQIKCQFIPTLEQIKLNQDSMCSTTSIMHVLFKHPIKSIEQEIHSRQALDLTFSQAEIWIIISSCLEALSFLSQNIGYQVSCNSQNIYIHKNGTIILSDAYKFTQFSSRHKVSYKNPNMGQNNETCRIRNLGIIGARLMKVQSRKKQQTHSAKLREFIQTLTSQQHCSYKQALNSLKYFQKCKKDYQKSPVYHKIGKQNRCLEYKAIQGLQKVESVNFLMNQQHNLQSNSKQIINCNPLTIQNRNNSRQNISTQKTRMSNSNILLKEINKKKMQGESSNVLKAYQSFKLDSASTSHNSRENSLLFSKSSKAILFEQVQQLINIPGASQTTKSNKSTQRNSLDCVNINQQNLSSKLKNKNRRSFIKCKPDVEQSQISTKLQQNMLRKDCKSRTNDAFKFNNTMPINRISIALNQARQQKFSKTGYTSANQKQNQNFDSLSSIAESNKATSSSGNSRAYDLILNWDQKDYFQEDQKAKNFSKNKKRRNYQMQLVLTDKNKIAIQFLRDRQRDVIFQVTQSDIEQSELGSRIVSSRFHSAKIQKMSLMQTPKVDKSIIS